MKAVGVWPQGYARRVLETVDSTNSEAARIAPELLAPTWILGLEQTAGRGRRGRPWVDTHGNFAATLVMQPDEPADRVALRSFVAALALFDALARVIGDASSLALKWPNDVLLNEGKLAGILLESAGLGARLSHFMIGIGVNLIHAPGAGDVETSAWRPVSLKGETGIEIGPEDFLAVLAETYAAREIQFSTYGFSPIRTAWLEQAARLGEVITAKTARETFTGCFETVDEHGNLVLSIGNTRHAIPAAEVFF